MTDWTAGCMADIGYTCGYRPELNLLSVRRICLIAGFIPPKIGTAQIA